MLLLSTNVNAAAAAAVSCGAVRRVCQLHHGYRSSGKGQFSQQHTGSCPINQLAVSGLIARRLYSTPRWVVACAAESKFVSIVLLIKNYDSG
jgi:hypothetical protein